MTPQPNKPSKVVEDIEKVLDTKSALNWARHPISKGYSESWLNGYEKAYGQVKNDIPRLLATFKKMAEDLIGEDSPENTPMRAAQNTLRATQRQKLKEMLENKDG